MNSTGSIAAWLVGRRIARADAAASVSDDPADPDA
jgi:hypothetical protein